MPTYQYRCTNCGQDLEVVQRFSDAEALESEPAEDALSPCVGVLTLLLPEV